MTDQRKTALNPPGVAKPIRGYYSNCVRVNAGPLLFIAGQVALDANGHVVGGGDVRAQTIQALENMRAILRANGADMSDVVSVTVYVTDIAFLDQITDIRMKYFPNNGPASAIVQIARLAIPELLIEISAVAAVP
ncbi:MAG TPA: RidA family protein [Stellaceae bacterium]|nr:RidA family protein [Stellaceae bacterium]